jgi:hypothetical protein
VGDEVVLGTLTLRVDKVQGLTIMQVSIHYEPDPETSP